MTKCSRTHNPKCRNVFAWFRQDHFLSWACGPNNQGNHNCLTIAEQLKFSEEQQHPMTFPVSTSFGFQTAKHASFTSNYSLNISHIDNTFFHKDDASASRKESCGTLTVIQEEAGGCLQHGPHLSCFALPNPGTPAPFFSRSQQRLKRDVISIIYEE